MLVVVYIKSPTTRSGSEAKIVYWFVQELMRPELCVLNLVYYSTLVISKVAV